MMDSALPVHDPTHMLDDLRACYLSHLLVIAATKYDIGSALSASPRDYEDLCDEFQLAPRPATVFWTAARAMGLIELTPEGQIRLSNYGREKLAPNSPFNLRGYLGLGASSADVQNLMACLEHDAPQGDVSFVFHADRGPSALDDPLTSDALTRAMAARAGNVAPYVARELDLSSAHRLLDLGGAHGIYSLELLKRNPHLQATIVDRRPPLQVAREIANASGLAPRVELVFGDIHDYSIEPDVDVVLMANILHDYDQAVAEKLVADVASQLRAGGRLIILDAFLDSVEDGFPPISSGPRPVAAYSAMLFSICEGRCYRTDEYQAMLQRAGLQLDPKVRQVPAHGSLLSGTKPSLQA